MMQYPNPLTRAQLMLMQAIERGDFEEMKAIVAQGCDPNFWTGRYLAASPLYLAALRGNYEMVSWLVDAGGAEVSQDMAAFFSGGMGQVAIGNFVAKRVLAKKEAKSKK